MKILRVDLSRVGLEDVEHDFLVGEGDRVEPGDRLHDHSEVPQVQSATYLQTVFNEKNKNVVWVTL